MAMVYVDSKSCSFHSLMYIIVYINLYIFEPIKKIHYITIIYNNMISC